MGWVNAILLWLHLGSLGLVGAATFGLPVIGAHLAKSDPAGREALGAVVSTLNRLGDIALAVLIATGLILIWSKFGGLGHLPAWFWVKMVLLVGLIGVLHMGRASAKKALAGDAAVVARLTGVARAGMALLLLIVLMAVIAFH